MSRTFAFILSVALFSITGCKSKKAEEPPVARGPESAADPAAPPKANPVPAPPASGLTDPQIAAIVVAANQVDIDAGQQAVKKSKNPEVVKFAQQMVTDHTAVNKAAVDLVTKLKVTPEPTDASKSLASGGNEKLGQLAKLDGDAFDKAYVDNEVAYHKAVIAVVDNQLIPSATNDELKNTLTGVKPTLDAHLKHAEQLQATLGAGAAPAGSASAGSASKK